MTGEYNSKHLFSYALVQMERRRYATAQAFWVFSLERFLKEQYRKETGNEPSEKDLRECGGIMGLIRKRNRGLYRDNRPLVEELWAARNQIVHCHFLAADSFADVDSGVLQKFYQLRTGTRKSLGDIRREQGIDPELETDLALRFGDRVSYKEKEVQNYSTINENDFNNDDLLEKEVWNLKYSIEKRLCGEPSFAGLETGLVSEFGVDSEWIWIPIGFGIKDENERVRSAIISVLILRSKTIRVHLDFGTEAIEQRLSYYHLIQKDETFRNLFEGLRQELPEIEFFNLVHYSQITKRIPIKDWLSGVRRSEVDDEIDKERRKLQELKKQGKKERRSNILLFGKEFELSNFPYETHELARGILEIVGMLLPFLRKIEGLPEAVL
jgi:hypothetical protein